MSPKSYQYGGILRYHAFRTRLGSMHACTHAQTHTHTHTHAHRTHTEREGERDYYKYNCQLGSSYAIANYWWLTVVYRAFSTHSVAYVWTVWDKELAERIMHRENKPRAIHQGATFYISACACVLARVCVCVCVMACCYLCSSTYHLLGKRNLTYTSPNSY